MVQYNIALDIGTSGLRCQAIDADTGETISTAITPRHPIPGMNVIDHVNFAITTGADQANLLLIGATKSLLNAMNIDLTKVKTLAVCGNPFQLSLFQNIEIRDLAYAGKNRLATLGVVSPDRDGVILKATDLGLDCIPNADVMIPPAVTHEIGADAIAMMLVTNALELTEPCLIVDYGTNAEMALVYDGKIITGSAAAGPAMEGQEIEKGMLAAPGAIADVEVTDKGWKCYVLDDNMINQPGDIVDPKTGKVVEEGPMHGKAIGITGTGVVAALSCGMDSGDIVPPNILSEDGLLHLQDGVNISSKDVDEAGKAIGALRAGFLTLLREAGLWVSDVKLAYMSGASGLYVDAMKAMKIGMVTPGAERIFQYGNTSIQLARELARGDRTMEELREFAKKLRAEHCMFATSQVFKDIYSIEFSFWCYGMPFSEYNNMLDVYDLPNLPDPVAKIDVKRESLTDLPDTDKVKVQILEDSGTVLKHVIEDCILCGACVRECPEKALEIGVVEGKSIGCVKSDRCAGTACRRCEAACKRQVLRMNDFSMTEVI